MKEGRGVIMRRRSIKKMTILLVLVVVLQTAFPVNTFASGINELDIVTIDTEEFEDANNALVTQGNISLKRRITNRLVFPYDYRQAGESWSSDIMQTCGKPIGSDGCCLTSFANIQRFFGGDLDPGEVNTRLGRYACPFDYRGAADIFGYTIVNLSTSTVSDSYAVSFIVGAIDSARPVLVGMSYSGGTHFVTAYGYSGNSIFIRDPAGRYSFLEDYFEAGYEVNRLCVYAD